MCVTMLGQAVYMIIMFVGLVLTLVSMFTPAWRSFTSKSQDIEDHLKNFEFGFFPFLCSDDMFPKTTSAPGTSTGSCKDFWKNQPTWEKVVIVCMALAIVAQLIALVWTGLTFCACCCKKYLVHPLPLLAILAAVFLGVAVIVFAIENKDSIDRLDSLSALQKQGAEATVSWSFYIACGAIVCMVANIILGLLVVRTAKTALL